MHNIVVFSGGTGSIAIQKGLSLLYRNDTYNLDIIINAYDNGKSTGACRRVFDNKILGPSDLRKNHMTQFEIQHKDKLDDIESREYIISDCFNKRLNAADKEECYDKICSIISNISLKVGKDDAGYLTRLADHFFFEDVLEKKWHPILNDIEFKDFSVANVFYSSAASLHENSLRIAGKELASFLQIKDNVHLISDVNLFLQAITESGYLIQDEEEIVCWNNDHDKIVSARLVKDGKEYVPTIDEEVDLSQVKSIKDIVRAADIIILSSGTQWSSLIPSYMHSGMRKLLLDSKAAKYFVVNNIEDMDMKGVSADENIAILAKYLPIHEFTAVVNLDAEAGLNSVSSIRSISGHIGDGPSKHNPEKLIALLMSDYFGISHAIKNTFVYDLDGTLWDERADKKGKAIGTENMNLFSGIIHSGNTYEHVVDVFKFLYHQETITDVYSDFGNVHFTSDDYNATILLKEYCIDDDVVKELENISSFKGKVKLRKYGCVITIKPLINREVLAQKAQMCLKKFGNKYAVHISGNTSIDIMRKDYSKKTMLKEIMRRKLLNPKEVVFVGNEITNGSEEGIRDLGVNVLQVDDIYECNILLKTLRKIIKS